MILSQTAKECKACMAQGRTAQVSGKRMVYARAFSQLRRIKEDGGKVRRSRLPRTRYDCLVCQIHLCQGGCVHVNDFVPG
jgi:hypothetical protein